MKNFLRLLMALAAAMVVPIATAQQSGRIERGGNYANIGSTAAARASVINGHGWSFSQSLGTGTAFSNVNGTGYNISGPQSGGVDLSLSAGSRYEASTMNISGGVGTGSAAHSAQSSYLAEGSSRYDGPGQYVLTYGDVRSMISDGKGAGLSMQLAAWTNQGVGALGYNTSDVVTKGTVSSQGGWVDRNFSTQGRVSVITNNATSYFTTGVLAVDGKTLDSGVVSGYAGVVQNAYAEFSDPVTK